MSTQNLTQNPQARNGQPTKSEQFSAAFLPDESNNRIDLSTFLTKRIVAFARLSMGTNPSHRLFWQRQISDYHAQLKNAMTNPVFKGVSDER